MITGLRGKFTRPVTSRVTIQEDPNYSFGNMLIRQTYDSGEILGVPVYPQARFQLAVCMAVIEKQKWDRSVVLSGVSDRHTGERDSEILTGRDQMKMKASQYWLNTKPRPFYFDSIGDE